MASNTDTTETSTVYAAARAGKAITDWRNDAESATADANAISNSMVDAKLTPDVTVISATRTVTYTNAMAVDAPTATE